jgi:hypothetical protein
MNNALLQLLAQILARQAQRQAARAKDNEVRSDD